MKKLLPVLLLIPTLALAQPPTTSTFPVTRDALNNWLPALSNGHVPNLPAGTTVGGVAIGTGLGYVTSAAGSSTNRTPVVMSGVTGKVIDQATADEVLQYTDPGYDFVAGYNTTTNLPVPYRFSDDETFSGNSAVIVPSQRATRYFVEHFDVPWANINTTGSDLADLDTRLFSDLQSKPTTLAGYGITSGVALNLDARSPVLTGSGTANAIVITPSPPASSYSDGDIYYFTPSNTNTGATTVNVSSLGTKQIKKINEALVDSNLAAGDLVAGTTYTINYDSSGGFFRTTVALDTTNGLLLQGDARISKYSLDTLPMIFEINGVTRSSSELFRFTSTDNDVVPLDIFYDRVKIGTTALQVVASGSAGMSIGDEGDLINIGSDLPIQIAVGGVGLHIDVDGSVSADGGFVGDDTAYDATTWNANLSAPTKNAVRDKFESLTSGLTIGTSPITSGTGTRLLYETSGNKVGEISGATSDGTTLTMVAPVLGTPASGTVTNLTGTASININGTVGATTPTTGAFTTVSETGAETNSKSGAASVPALTLSGVPFAGTGTTSFPLLYVNDANATASTTLSTAGTYLGVNGDGTQNLMDLLKDGTSQFKVSSAGVTTTNGDLTIGGNITGPSGGWNFYRGANLMFYIANGQLVHFRSQLGGWSSGSVSAPSFTIEGDTNTGLYPIGADDIGISTGGVLRLEIGATGATSGAFQSAGTATSCTGATIGSGSKANAGFVTATTTGASTIVITFPFTATTGWSVMCTNITNTATLIQQTAKSTTTATLSGATASGDVIQYIAMAY